MSKEIYGYLENPEISDGEFFLKSIEEKTGLGVSPMPVTELYNYPRSMLPLDADKSIGFIIGDKPGKINATYLIDCNDFAPHADIGLPLESKARLKLLTHLLVFMFEESKAARFMVAITDSSQIAEVKIVDIKQLEALIVADFQAFSPPDCLYSVIAEKSAD